MRNKLEPGEERKKKGGGAEEGGTKRVLRAHKSIV
jgi:hypothetical protein